MLRCEICKKLMLLGTTSGLELDLKFVPMSHSRLILSFQIEVDDEEASVCDSCIADVMEEASTVLRRT